MKKKTEFRAEFSVCSNELPERIVEERFLLDDSDESASLIARHELKAMIVERESGVGKSLPRVTLLDLSKVVQGYIRFQIQV